MGSQTWRVWRTALPRLLIVWVTGWLIYQASIELTAPIQETHPWPAVIIFSVGLVCHLACIIIGIRLAGEPAGLWEKLPAAAACVGRDEPLLKVVSISLLPFVGVYAAFGGIEQATYSLYISGALESTAVLNPQSATTLLDPRTAQQRLVIGAVLLGCYLLRRGLEAAADRTGRWLFGLLSALVEGFFSVVLVFGGARMLGDLGAWLRSRVFYGWLLDAGAAVLAWLGEFHLVIPRALASAWEFTATVAWPLLVDALLQPLLWLAVAGLVFGTYTLSVAELWQRADERDALGAQLRRNRWLHRLQQRAVHASSGSRRVMLQFIDAFVSDLEGRVVPFVQSMRHVLRVGLPFVGAYALIYALVSGLQTLAFYIPMKLIGGHSFNFWRQLEPVMELAGGVLAEPLRMSLLAVAMTATLVVNRPARPPLAIGRALTALVTLASLLAAGGVVWLADWDAQVDSRQVSFGAAGELISGQPMRVTGLSAGRQLSLGGTEYPGLRTDALFLGVMFEAETTHVRPVRTVECDLWAQLDDGGWARVLPANDRLKATGQLGFTVRGMFVFERPADGLVGSQLRCRPYSFYLFYEPELVFDLGIDQARQAQLGTQDGVLHVPGDVEELP